MDSKSKLFEAIKYTVLGALLITFVFFVIYTPVTRRICRDKAVDYGLDVHPLNNDYYSKEAEEGFGVSYSIHYMTCVNNRGVSE